MRVENGGDVSAVAIGDRSEWGEWMLALVVSLLINLTLMPFAIGLMESVSLREPAAAPQSDAVAMIYPDMLEVEEAEPAQAEKPREFRHTSPDQETGRSERARYIGERDTAAAADKAPAENDLMVPSQDGRDSLREDDIETVTRRYQDGDLEHSGEGNPAEAALPAAPVAPVEPAEAAAEPAAEEMPEYVQEAPKRERLAEGPDPVDQPLPPEVAGEKERMSEAAQQPVPAKAAETPRKPAPPAGGKPGFQGNQIKTRLKGSISRRGASALDVESNSVGRYQAALNRAVEREWQRNCVRYRDFITPGFLTLRFLVEADGAVRSIEFIEVVEAGEIQKGFTLNAVRSAPIPPMPAELKRELDGDPLELIYNFYF